MGIEGLDMIKKTGAADEEQTVNVTGLDFNSPKPVASEEHGVTGLDFISHSSDTVSDTEDHGVTGLDFIKRKEVSDEDHGVTGLDFISREKETGQESGEISGLDSIKQTEFHEIGIHKLD